MTAIPDALADHRMLVSSLGKKEAGHKQSSTKIEIERANICNMEEQTENVTYLTQDKSTGHLLQLDDGTTVFFPSVTPLVNGQTITLEDGTTAFIQTDQPDDKINPAGLQMVELPDGTTAYVTMVEEEEEEEEEEETTSVTNLNLQAEKAQSDNKKDQIDTQMKVATKAKSFKCTYDDCGKYYSTHHHLKVHERKHTGVRPFKCTVDNCEKAFATSYSLKSHMRTHTGEKPYECPDVACDKSFKTSGDLQKHVRTHTGERPFQCTFEGCDRSFTTSNIRKVHMRTHTGEKPYVCPEPSCDRSFASATNYKNHRRIHSGEKPYVCSIQGCDKRFTEYSSLYKHHIVHSQQKPYFCSICARNYRQAYTLTMHKRTAHGIIESDDGTDIYLDEELAAQLFSGTKRKRANITVQPTEPLEEVCVQLVDTTEGISDARHTTTLVAMQGASARTIQEVAKAAATCNGQTQILIVTDPAQLAALQQIGVPASTAVLSSMKEDTAMHSSTKDKDS